MKTEQDCCFNVLGECISQESQQQFREILYKKQNFTNFKTQIHLPLECTTKQLSDTQGSDESSEDSFCGKRSKKAAMIGKSKRLRKFDKEKSKWKNHHEKKYWKFYLVDSINRPYSRTSWGRWKGDSIYKKMETFIGKTAKQCKSKDQNMKAKNQKLYPGKDIVDVAVIKLQEWQERDQEIETLIEEYRKLEKGQSDHMKMLNQKLKLLKKQAQRIEVLLMY